MSASKFVYVTYIRATPEQVWEAFTSPEFTRRYWMATHQECTWERGASWKMMLGERLMDAGEVLEIDPPRRLVLAWQNQFREELKAEGFSRMTCEIEIEDDLTRMTITHEIDVPDSKLIQGVSGGWPIILSSMKTLLETGEPLAGTDQVPEGI